MRPPFRCPSENHSRGRQEGICGGHGLWCVQVDVHEAFARRAVEQPDIEKATEVDCEVSVRHLQIRPVWDARLLLAVGYGNYGEPPCQIVAGCPKRGHGRTDPRPFSDRAASRMA